MSAPPPERTLTAEQTARLDAAWESLENGELETAALEIEQLLLDTGDHPEARLLAGAALLEMGDPQAGREELLAVRGRVEDPQLLSFYLAGACFELGQFADAERELRALLTEEPEEPAGHFALAQVLEHREHYDEAETAYERAHELDPEGYPLPMRMSRKAFEEAVREAAASLPDELSDHLQELPVIVQDLPGSEALDADDGDLVSPGVLGLYVGQSLREESVFDASDTPRGIYIYQRNLEHACHTHEELVEEIATTLYHELGHYLGLDEEDLEERGVD